MLAYSFIVWILQSDIYVYVYRYKYIIFCKIRGELHPAFYSIKVSLVCIFKSLYVQVLTVEVDYVEYVVTGGSLRQNQNITLIYKQAEI